MTSTSYRYRAARSDGSIEEGSVRVLTRDAAAAYLSERSLFAIDLEPEHEAHARRIPAGDLAVGLRTLATLLDSGLPIARALSAFEEVAPQGWRAIVPLLRERVKQGDGLAQALDRSGHAVPELIVGVIHGAETGGGLAASVDRAASIAEASAELQASIRNALAYPALLAVVGTLSIGVVIAVVLPRFAAIIADVGAEPPVLARAAIALGSMGTSLVWSAILVVAAGALAWRHYIAKPGVRQRFHKLLLTLPWVGELRLSAASSRSCAALAAVLHAGIPVSAGLQLASRSAGDAEISTRLLRARERIVGGARLSSAMTEEGCITTTAQRLIRAGEESGHLAVMLDRASSIDMQALSQRLKALVRLIEPTLIIAFAAVVGLVAAALLQAVYAVRPS